MARRQLEILEEEFEKESNIWIDKVLLKIYGVHVWGGPGSEEFIDDDDLRVERESLSTSIFFENTRIAFFTFAVRYNQVMIFEMEKPNLKNLLTHRNVSTLDSWKISQYCELPSARI